MTSSRPSSDGLDFYTQARKALTERCPFDSDETAPKFGTLPFALTSHFHKKSDKRRKHRKVQEDAIVKAIGPGRPTPGLSVWDKAEAYFRPVTLDDIDLLGAQLPPDSCFCIPGYDNVVEDEVVKDETVVKEELESIQVKADQTLEEAEVEDKKALNWILGCKQRFLLNSGRPSKKRKMDLGLELLLQLPCMKTGGAETPVCDFCCSGESDVKSNRLLLCDSCKVSVHQKCYGIHQVPSGDWLCSWCSRNTKRNNAAAAAADADDASFIPCMLCPKIGGALKPLERNLEDGEETKFVHLFCCLWIPGMYVKDVGAMEPVMNVEGLQGTRRRLVCNLCKVKRGICVRCSHGMRSHSNVFEI